MTDARELLEATLLEMTEFFDEEHADSEAFQETAQGAVEVLARIVERFSAYVPAEEVRAAAREITPDAKEVILH